MAYLALYRKYRPKTFDEVIGQDSIIKIFKNQIKYNRVGHAYLLSGIRGTGKTSLAKIFAKAINCPNNQDGNPCNVCDVCQKIDASGIMDIIEIDGASNRGVDEIREIREKVKYPPVIGKYKVYIIDEVHMLTKEAFNALLKTLEEPPEHIVFILATTEPNKCPTTILSRCQRFEIKPISTQLIMQQLRKISNDLNLDISDESLEFIAARGDHSMRDALSLMDQIIDLKDENGKIEYSEMLSFMGMANRNQIHSLIGQILEKNPDQVILELRKLQETGKESQLIMDQMIQYTRDLLIVKTTGQAQRQILKCGDEALASYQKLAETTSTAELYIIIDHLIKEKTKLKYSSLQNIILEMACLKLAFENELQFAENVVIKKSQLAEETVSVLAKTANNTKPVSKPVDYQKVKPERIKEVVSNQEVKRTEVPVENNISEVKTNEKKMVASGKSVKQLFEKLCSSIGSAQRMCMVKGIPTLKENIFTILFSEENRNFIDFINTPQHIADFEKILKEETDTEISVEITVEKENFNEMDMIEKTRRIINDESVEIIKN